MIKAIATDTFVHGAHTFRPGDQAEFSPPVFASLSGYGLVREAAAKLAEQKSPSRRAASQPANKKAPEPLNKMAAESDNKQGAVPGAQTDVDGASTDTGASASTSAAADSGDAAPAPQAPQAAT